MASAATPLPDPTSTTARRLLVVAAALLFTARLGALALPSMDDCFYARKAVEMLRSGAFFTVTWNGEPTFQNPPLQFVVVARFMQVFGRNDVAAILPSALMALGLVLVSLRIGRLLLGAGTALTAAALMLLVPEFLNQARRCMLDVPTAWWVALAMLAWLEARRRPVVALAAAPAIAAAMLTKSVIALLAPAVLVAAAIAHPDWRAVLRGRWTIAGLLLGVALGLSWSLHEYLRFGEAAMRSHYLVEVGRSLHPMPIWARVGNGLRILFQTYAPLAVLMPFGVPALWRAWRRDGDAGAAFTLAWALVPLAAVCASSAQSPHYLFPALPAFALVAAAALRRFPRVTTVLPRVVAGLLVAGAVVFWVRPQWLGRGENVTIRARAGEIGDAVPAGRAIVAADISYWRIANPFLYYAGRYVEPDPGSVPAAVERARGAGRGYVVCPPGRAADVLAAAGPGARVVLRGDRWALVRVAPIP